MLTGIVDLAAQRTAKFLFGTFLLSQIVAGTDLTGPGAAWKPIVERADLAYRHADFEAARDLASRALAVASSTSAPESEIASILNVMGTALLRLNKPAEAAPLLDRALSIRRGLRSSPNLELAASLTNQASALVGIDAIRPAREAASEAVAMFETLGETKRFEYGVALNNLAAAESNLGDYAQSVSVYERARENLVAQSPPDPPRLVRLFVNEGIAVQRLGNLERASSLFESAVELARREPMPDAFALPNALNALGDLRALQGRYDDARRVVAEALRLASAAVPPDRLKTGVIEATLARVDQGRGNLQAAAEHFESALAALRSAPATAPVAYASELNNYGLLLLSMKRLGPAGEAFEEAQRIFDAKLGAAHPNSIAVTVNRGTLAERRHQFPRASELYRKALDLDTAHFGRNHFRVAMDMNSLGTFEHRRHHYQEAEPLLREAVSILRSVWGPDHPQVGIVESNLGRTLGMLKRYDEAEPVLADSIRVLVQAYGKDSAKLLPIYDDYAQLLRVNERYAESEKAKLAATRIRFRQAAGTATTFN